MQLWLSSKVFESLFSNVLAYFSGFARPLHVSAPLCGERAMRRSKAHDNKFSLSLYWLNFHQIIARPMSRFSGNRRQQPVPRSIALGSTHSQCTGYGHSVDCLHMLQCVVHFCGISAQGIRLPAYDTLKVYKRRV